MLMNRASKPRRFEQTGVTMLEALITVVILAFGILGLANLQAKMQNAEVESYARSQALVLLDDMAARAASPVGTGEATVQPTDCSGVAFGADRDVCEWSNALKGRAELDASAIAVGAMIGGRG